MNVKVSLPRKELKKLIEEKTRLDKSVNLFIGLLGLFATGVYLLSYYKGQVSLVYPTSVAVITALIVGALEYYDRKKMERLSDYLNGEEDENVEVTLEVTDIKL